MGEFSTIQWFPGHMAKARRLVQENLKLVDVVIELLDARIPNSSRNPMIDEILSKKPRLVILNKADLADKEITKSWLEYFESDEISSLAIDSVKGSGITQVSKRAHKLMESKFADMLKTGRRMRAVRCMIVGIPNVGKSSFINRITGRKSTLTGDRPGVTKGKQMIKIDKDLELLDTPGILWPKFEDVKVGLKLAATGAVKEQVINVEEVAFYLLKILMKMYPQGLCQRYKLDALLPDAFDVLKLIGEKRGLLISKGNVDTEKASVLLLKEFRSGKLGAISLEKPV